MRLQILILVACSMPIIAHAQQFTFQTYGFEAGLLNLGVESLVQDRDGYLWVGTQGGLYRFDGDRFERVRVGDSPAEIHVQTLHAAPDGAIWLMTADGLYVRREDRFEKVHVEGAPGFLGPASIDSDGSGRLYIATRSGLYSTCPGRDGFCRIWPRKPNGPKRSYGVKALGRAVWYGCGAGVCRLENGKVTEFGQAEGLQKDGWFSFVQDRSGLVWARGVRSLMAWSPSTQRFTSLAHPVQNTSEWGVPYVDPSGRLFVPTDNGLAFMSASGGWTYLRRQNGLPITAVKRIIRDRDGNVWLGTSGAGLARWLGFGSWSAWTESQGLSSESIWAIHHAPDGVTWIGTGHGIHRMSRHSPDSTPAAVPGVQHRALTIAQDRDGGIWIPGAERGIMRVWARSGGRKVLQQGLPVSALAIMKLAVDTENRMWVASRELHRSSALDHDPVRFERVQLPSPVTDAIWWDLAVGPDGAVWAAGNAGLFKFVEGRLVQHLQKKDGLLETSVYAVHPRSSEVWVAYELHGGASTLTWRGNAFDVRHHLEGSDAPVSRAYALASDARGRLWAGTGNGLQLYESGRWRRIGTDEGLIWPDCNKGALSVDNLGAVWIGTSRGLSRFSGAEPPMAQPPTVSFTKILAGSQPFVPTSATALPYSRRSVEFQFTAPIFRNPAEVRFRYRLAGLEDEWIETSAKSVRYPALAPAKYQMEVEARSANGTWGSPTALSFEVRPAWWLTWWFEIIAAGLSLAGVAGIYLWRVRLLRQRHEELTLAVQNATAEIEGQKRQIEMLLEKSEQSNRAKTEFVANMSHELRTPLTGVLGIAELLLGTDLSDDQKQDLNTLRHSAQGLLGILNDTLDLSKIEAGRMDLVSEPFDVRKTIHSAASALEAAARRKGLELQVELDSTLPVQVRGDAFRYRQVLINLLGNAVKFTDAGFVRVTARRSDIGAGEVKITTSVSDTGIGIPASEQSRIFEAFRQADSSSTRRYSGTGLGLSISSRIASLMGGRIEVLSEPGRGSTFHFIVRFTVLHETSHPATPAALKDTAIPGLRLLLAEDNAINAKVLRRLLEKQGHQVSVAENGRIAVNMLSQRAFDAVLMDVHMPEMDGLEATQRIRQEQRPTGVRTPIIGVTALAMEGDRDLCIASGMDDCIHKPVDLAELSRALLNATRAAPARSPETPAPSIPAVE